MAQDQSWYSCRRALFPWSRTGNCSYFASATWNEVNNSNKLSAGVIATPKTLVNNIKKVSGYQYGAAVPFDGGVYDANGTGAIMRSVEHN